MSIDVRDDRTTATHDLKILERHLASVQDMLQRLVTEDRMAELIPIWKRPGWTTPAEFFLVHSSLMAIETQVRTLETSIATLVEGAGLVGPRG